MNTQSVQKKTYVTNNSGNNEWYTPSNIIELSRESLGIIDIDPCSNETAQRIVKACQLYTTKTNGLDKPWYGNIWMNPPLQFSTD